ncbi:MAG: CMP-N-acetylneuraminic acid synthetase [SAR324 cluster bacterium]|uniref:CMP-N-acetylneuraminic acid synthetase n=1 Tax=SAR324 cluster bacterium TaxID=2024889 RepID=A0A2A4T146_9DELT|nr:MAG: CMP-N-acetylneuraminic acid synthetase [SAR324 cluster bacterium]
MKILITICGRAGSKGVKNKNIRNFLGHPLVAYTISVAEQFRERSEHEVDICISSDSKPLLEIGTHFSEIVSILRCDELAEDATPKMLVLKDALAQMEKLSDKSYDYLIDLDITSPLRKVSDVENALNTSIKNKVDVVLSAVASRRNPYFNMVEKTEEGISLSKTGNFSCRQDVPEVYDINASIYSYSCKALTGNLRKSPLDGSADLILMEDTGILDIDHEHDFTLMEVLAAHLFKHQFREVKDYLEKI